MLFEHVLSFTFGKHIKSITDTLTVPESKYHNSLMERKTAVNTLGGWYVGHWGLLLEKHDIFNNMNSTKVFKQMEQITSNSTSFA